MLGFNIITIHSMYSVPYRSPSLLPPQSSFAQHCFALAETQNEPAKFTQRFIAYITLAHVYANSYLHTQNVCLLLPACFIFACYGCPCKFSSNSINYLLPHNQYIPFPKAIHFRPHITPLSCKSTDTVMSPTQMSLPNSFYWFCQLCACPCFLSQIFSFLPLL